MNVVDLFSLAGLLAGVVTGVLRGAGHGALRLVQVVLCVWGSFALREPVGKMISWVFELPPGRPRILGPFLAAFVLLYGLTTLAIFLLRKKSKPSRTSRLIGAGLGALHAAGLLLVLLMVLAWFATGWGWLRGEMATSISRDEAEVVGRTLEGNFLPAAYTDLFREVKEKAK